MGLHRRNSERIAREYGVVVMAGLIEEDSGAEVL